MAGLSGRAGPGVAPPKTSRVVWTLRPLRGEVGALGVCVVGRGVSAAWQEEGGDVCACTSICVSVIVNVCFILLCVNVCASVWVCARACKCGMSE